MSPTWSWRNFAIVLVVLEVGSVDKSTVYTYLGAPMNPLVRLKLSHPVTWFNSGTRTEPTSDYSSEKYVHHPAAIRDMHQFQDYKQLRRNTRRACAFLRVHVQNAGYVGM